MQIENIGLPDNSWEETMTILSANCCYDKDAEILWDKIYDARDKNPVKDVVFVDECNDMLRIDFSNLEARQLLSMVNEQQLREQIIKGVRI